MKLDVSYKLYTIRRTFYYSIIVFCIIYVEVFQKTTNNHINYLQHFADSFGRPVVNLPAKSHFLLQGLFYCVLKV